MTRHWLTALALAATLATAVQAETVRLPESGDPAFTVALPDGWTHEVLSNGSLKAFSADHTAAITLAIVATKQALEELGAQAIHTADGMPPQTSGAAEISGYKGLSFDGTTVNGDGVRAKVHLIVVRLDGAHLAVAGVMTAENLDAEKTAAAAAVLSTATLTKAVPPPVEAAQPAPPPTPPSDVKAPDPVAPPPKP